MQIVGQGALHARAIKFCEANGIDSDEVAFSINNPHILTDSELDGKRWYNVHAGLTQRYRGIGEVCVFAAICEGAKEYGVTLHRIMPRQTVDSGPVVAQRRFDLRENATFADVMEQTLTECRLILEENVREIVGGTHKECTWIVSPRPRKYRDIPLLIESTAPDRLERACNLGKYAGYLPRLVDMLNEYA